MKSLRSCCLVSVFAVLLTLPGLVGCVSKRSEMGVENDWRGSSPPVFEKGRSTQSEVLRSLGPPSQVIALHDQTVLYYLREKSRTGALYLLFYNSTRQKINYDRAIFFFDKQGLLSELAYSKEDGGKK